MAGERKGKAYEAIVYLALKELVDDGTINGPVHWNVTPSGMSIDPDFTFGKDPDRPDMLLLVSHCGSTGDSHKKFWRNLGELVEAKTMLTAVPRVFCLTFGLFKEELVAIQTAAFDGFDYIRLADEPDHLKCEIAQLAQKKQLQMAIVEGDISISRPALSYLKKRLKHILSHTNSQMDRLWKEHAKRSPPLARAPLPSSVRRGIAKLLVIPDWDTAEKLFAKKQAVDGPEVLSALAITRTMKGKLLAHDPEVVQLFQSISLDTLRTLYQKDWGPSVARMVDRLRKPERSAAIADYFKQHKKDLCDQTRLTELLESGHRRTGARIGLQADDGNWLFDFYLAVVKAVEGNKNAYGYAQIAKDVVDNDGFGAGLRDESKKLLLSPWGNLSEWSSGEIELEDDIIAALAAALISHSAPVPDWSKTIDEAMKIYLSTYLESKLAAHRSLDPVGTIVLKELGGRKQRLPTCFAERIGTNRSGRTECLHVHQTLIKWQSCTDSGRAHKKKELCGRAIGLRYHWSGQKFMPRPGVNKMILVLDGTWQQDDFNALLHAGWDDIFYPDEMDRLVKATV